MPKTTNKLEACREKKKQTGDPKPSRNSSSGRLCHYCKQSRTILRGPGRKSKQSKVHMRNGLNLHSAALVQAKRTCTLVAWCSSRNHFWNSMQQDFINCCAYSLVWFVWHGCCFLSFIPFWAGPARWYTSEHPLPPHPKKRRPQISSKTKKYQGAHMHHEYHMFIERSTYFKLSVWVHLQLPHATCVEPIRVRSVSYLLLFFADSLSSNPYRASGCSFRQPCPGVIWIHTQLERIVSKKLLLKASSSVRHEFWYSPYRHIATYLFSCSYAPTFFSHVCLTVCFLSYR